ncbi:transcription factor 7-like 2 [Plectropomus leopardus]|uniref:transcription factor 7-like 2 n=1 Tax=Plectropomus leopardus TaxID=160734 RepID=UPI001C4ACAA9|nr:transcription factor 7-like 2 [Plectropomus leopardus]
MRTGEDFGALLQFLENTDDVGIDGCSPLDATAKMDAIMRAGEDFDYLLQSLENLDDGGIDGCNPLGASPSHSASPSPPSPSSAPAEHDSNIHPQPVQSPADSGYGEWSPFGASSSPPPPPVVPAGQESDIHPQPVNSQVTGGYDGCNPLGEAPLMAAAGVNTVHAAPIQQTQAVMQPGHLHNQGQYDNVPVVTLPQDLTQNLCPVGVFNGEMVYGIPAGSSNSASPLPPLNTSISNKRKRDDSQDDRPHIKKPLNAFMLYMKEQRPKYSAEMHRSGTATVNAFLGEKWNALSTEEKEKYFEEAHREKKLHEERYPEWSSLDNYVCTLC